jgi:hypothetical protein
MIATIETEIPIREKSPSRSASKLLPLALLLYATSLIKFFVRDPLGTQTGPQGPIEVLLVVAAALALVPALRHLHFRPFVTSSAKAFMLFGALAAASAIFSYDPVLSFVKAITFLMVCGIAVTASTEFSPAEVLRCFFYAVLTVLIAGLIWKLASGGPWFQIDDYSGRARFSLFALHPGSLADLAALTLLTSMVLPKRPPIYLEVLLFAVNIATAARTSSALLVLVLLFWGATAVRLTPRTWVLCGILASLATLTVWAGLQLRPHKSGGVGSIAESLYGDKLNEDVATLSGRTEVWNAAESLLPKSLILGFGIDGARDVLITETSWGAGNAHNSLLELLLAGGLPATLVFLFAWAGSARRAWLSERRLRLRTLGIYGYIAAFGMTAPNLTYLQYLAVFLIILLDSMLYTQFTSGGGTACLCHHGLQ